MTFTIGIIGNGFVGKATSLLECPEIVSIIYDIKPELCKPSGTTLADITNCDLIFISVPTPSNKDGSCHLKVLESVVKELEQIQSLDSCLVLNRCTVPVSTSDRLKCYFMPEFLTEKNFEHDFIHNPDWIFGLKGTPQDTLFKEKVQTLINLAQKYNRITSDSIHFVSNKTAESIKLFRNTYLATKVGFCNEFYQFSTKVGVNYETVRELATRDKRIGSSHTIVPGHDGKYGFGGTCFPKDTNNLLNQMTRLGMESYILKGVVERNERVDRPEQDWKLDTGRAFSGE